MDKKKKRDLILVAAVLAAAGILYLLNLFLFSKPAVTLEISVNGTVVETLDLSKDTEITINSKNNGTNLLIIKGGEAYISEASCPDSLCIHQGKIHKNGEMIVCLPNEMIAKIQGGEDIH